jgi:dolichyl-phosphate-mannose--protein O-mannosyl transferase
VSEWLFDAHASAGPLAAIEDSGAGGRFLRRLRGLARSIELDAPLGVLLVGMLALGVFLRVHALGAPDSLKWDEVHYVETARSYLAHQYAWNDHPPLGKLVILASMAIFGDKPFAWRLAPLFFGLANIGLVAWLARTAFRSRRAAVIAAAFVAIDGFFIAYSRAALLDGMIVAMGLVAVTTLLRGRTLWHVAAAGIAAGCATSIKLNGLAFLATVTVMCLASRPVRRYTPLVPGLAVLVFYAQCAFALRLTGRSGSVAAVIAENREMVRHHLSYTVVHPFSSRWYTWFLPLRPIFLRRDVDVDGSIRALLTLGHPLLWWGSSVAVIAALVLLVRAGPRRLWRECSGGADAHSLASRCAPRCSAIFWLVVAWAGPVVFWMPSLRDSYVYHYLPSYAFALVLLAGFTDKLYRQRRFLVVASLAIVALVAVLYSPVWGEWPIALEPLNGRLFFRFWR